MSGLIEFVRNIFQQSAPPRIDIEKMTESLMRGHQRLNSFPASRSVSDSPAQAASSVQQKNRAERP